MKLTSTVTADHQLADHKGFFKQVLRFADDGNRDFSKDVGRKIL